jgi:hypothetical protein
MFPAGAPGIGLALLRASVAATLLIAVSTRPTAEIEPWLAFCLALLLFAGILTPVVATLSGLLQIVHFVLHKGGALEAGLYLAEAIAVALLGPGAYSVDAIWFGRRLLRGPNSDPDDPR